MPYIRYPLRPQLLDGEHGLVPCSDELAVVIPEIPAHFERGQLGERAPPVEAVLPAALPLKGPSRYDVQTGPNGKGDDGESKIDSNLTNSVQGSAKEWSLGCVKRNHATYFLADPCRY